MSWSGSTAGAGGPGKLTYRPVGGSVADVPETYIEKEEVISVVRKVCSKYYRNGMVAKCIADDILFDLGLK